MTDSNRPRGGDTAAPGWIAPGAQPPPDPPAPPRPSADSPLTPPPPPPPPLTFPASDPLLPPPGGVPGPRPPRWPSWPGRKVTAITVLAALALLVVEDVAAVLAAGFGRTAEEVTFWVLGPLVAAGAATLVARRVRWPLWGQRRWQWTDVGVGLLGGLAVFGIDELWWRAEEWLLPLDGPPVQAFIADGLAATPIVVGIGVALATPIGEEAVFRGVLYRGVAASTPRWLAVVISAIVFGYMHLEGTSPLAWSLAANATVAGVVFAVLYERTGHLLAPIVAHAFVNATAVTTGLLVGGAVMVLSFGPGGDVPAVELPVGACARTDIWDGGAITAEHEIDCSDPHDVEVAYHGPFPEGLPRSADVIPSTDPAVIDLADSWCLDVFDLYVGIAWEDSMLDVVPLLPTEQRWAAGHRELACVIVPYGDDELTEPAEGSRG